MFLVLLQLSLQLLWLHFVNTISLRALQPWRGSLHYCCTHDAITESCNLLKVKQALWKGGIERSNKPESKRNTPGLEKWQDLVST